MCSAPTAACRAHRSNRTNLAVDSLAKLEEGRPGIALLAGVTTLFRRNDLSDRGIHALGFELELHLLPGLN